MYGNQSVRDARAIQRGNARGQQEDEVRVLDSELITEQGTQEQEIPKSPTVGQVKVTVHEVADEEEIMPELAYSQAMARLIEVNNAKVKKKAKKIGSCKKKNGRVRGYDVGCNQECRQVHLSTGGPENHRDP